jgi:hypothetical protein
MDFYCGGQTSFCESMVPYGLAQITNWAFAFCGWRLRGGGVYKSVRKKNLLRKKKFKRRVCLPFFCTPKKMTLTVEEELQNKDPPTSSFITILKLFSKSFFLLNVA